jgi:hypothetical protein
VSNAKQKTRELLTLTAGLPTTGGAGVKMTGANQSGVEFLFGSWQGDNFKRQRVLANRAKPTF